MNDSLIFQRAFKPAFESIHRIEGLRGRAQAPRRQRQSGAQAGREGPLVGGVGESLHPRPAAAPDPAAEQGIHLRGVPAAGRGRQERGGRSAHGPRHLAAGGRDVVRADRRVNLDYAAVGSRDHDLARHARARGLRRGRDH